MLRLAARDPAVSAVLIERADEAEIVSVGMNLATDAKTASVTFRIVCHDMARIRCELAGGNTTRERRHLGVEQRKVNRSCERNQSFTSSRFTR